MFNHEMNDWLCQPFTLMVPCHQFHCQMPDLIRPILINISDGGPYKRVDIILGGPTIMNQCEPARNCLKKQISKTFKETIYESQKPTSNSLRTIV